MSTFKLSGYAKITLLAFSFSFIFLRVFNSSTVVNPPYGGDDGGYFIWTESFFKYGSFNWCKGPLLNEEMTNSCRTWKPGDLAPYNKYPPGPALLLLPFNLIGKIVGGGPTDPYFMWSWIGTFFLFLFGCLLLYDLTARLIADRRIAFWTTVFFLTGNVVLYYVFRRPFMAHAAEFFLFFLAANLITRDYQRPPRDSSFFLLGLIAGLTLITRFSSFYMVGMLPVCSLYFQSLSAPKRRLVRSAIIYGVGFGLPFAFFLLTNYIQKGTWVFSAGAYDKSADPANYFFGHPRNYVRIPGFFFGPHAGAYLMMPFLAFEAVIAGALFKKMLPDLKKHWLLVAALVLGSTAQLIFMANHPTNGMSYGNRYLLNSFYVQHIAFIFIVARYGLPGLARRVFIPLGLVLAYFAAMNVSNFESTPELRIVPGKLNEEGIVDPAWKDFDTLIFKNYARDSLKRTLHPGSLTSFGVTPVVAYPLMALKNQLRGVPALNKAYEYYESPYRNVNRWSDLRILIYYHFAIFLLLVLGGLVFAYAPLKKART